MYVQRANCCRTRFGQAKAGCISPIRRWRDRKRLYLTRLRCLDHLGALRFAQACIERGLDVHVAAVACCLRTCRHEVGRFGEAFHDGSRRVPAGHREGGVQFGAQRVGSGVVTP